MANIFTGDQYDNFLHGTPEDDILRGLGGDDVLMGSQGNDILEGGSGNDRLHGMEGNNTYLFGRGDGQDVIMSPDSSISKHNMIRFGEGIASSDIKLERVNDSLVLRIAGTTDSITIDNYFMRGWGSDQAAHPFGIEEIRFFDGAAWDRASILTKLSPLWVLDDGDNFYGGGNVDGKGGNDVLMGSWDDDVMLGGDGNDELHGMDGDDILTGGAGNDFLVGGSGANTFNFAPGWGHDKIALAQYGGPSATIIDIAGALPGTLQLSRSEDGLGKDLIIAAKGAPDTITVSGFFENMNMDSPSRGVRLTFADHSVWDYNRINQALLPMPAGEVIVGTDGSDWLNGNWGDDRIDGGAGDDNLNGMWGNDVLLGGEGHDRIYGNEGDDLLVAGAGDDVLDGGYGNDVLIGGDGTDVLYGGDGDDILDAGAGNALLDGGMGNNLFRIGRDAHEVRLHPMPDATNTILFGADVRPEDIVVTLQGGWEVNIAIRGTYVKILTPLLIDFPDSAGGRSTQTFVQLKFADGTVWENDMLVRLLYTGDDFANTITGSWGADTMDGKGGDDYLQGNDGNDQIRGGSGDDYLYGGYGNDILQGQDGNDQLIGDAGDDLLNGGAGDDILIGVMGNDVYQVDLHGGIDTVYSFYQSDSKNALQFGEGIAPEDVLVRIEQNGQLVLTLNGGQDQVTVFGYLSTYDYRTVNGLSEVRFANGVIWNNDELLRQSLNGDESDNRLEGTENNDSFDGKGGNDVILAFGGDDTLQGGSGDDYLEGGWGNNTFIGGSGNDQLMGDYGADTYIFNIGDGYDRLDEFSWSWGYGQQPNVIRFGAGIAPADLRFEQYADTLYIHYGEQDVISVMHFNTNGADANLPVNRFEFADNSVWSYRELSNHAPELVWPAEDTFVYEGGTLALEMAPRFIDRDGEELRYELELVEGGSLPAWLSIDPLTGLISGTPDYAQSGVLMLKVTARDKFGAAASDEFKLKVYEFDPAPQLQHPISTQDAVEASPFSLVIPVDTFVDPDGGPLSYTLSLSYEQSLPAWLHFDSATMTLSGTPGDADTGTVDLLLTAVDSSGQAAFTHYKLNVANINQAPVLVQVPADQLATEGSAFSVKIPSNTFADADLGDKLSYSLELVGGPLPAWLDFNTTSLMLTGTPGHADTGSMQLRLTAADGGGKTVSTEFTLTVGDINQAPVLVHIPDYQFATEASPFSITFPVTAFTDGDGDVLSYSLATIDGPLPAWLSFDSAGMTLSGVAADADTGILQLRLSATDSGGLVAVAQFELIVANVNQAPVLVQVPADRYVDERSSFSITIPAGTFADADGGDVLSYSMALPEGPLPTWLTFDSASMTLSGTPHDTDRGMLMRLNLTATDSGGASVDTSFLLTVNNVNRAPTLVLAPAAQSATEASPFSVTFPAGTFVDADGADALRYSLTLTDGPLPAWLKFSGGGMTLSGTPGDADTGTLQLRLTATDGMGAATSAEFTLDVGNINQAPVLARVIANHSATEASPFSVTIPAGTFADADAGDVLNYKLALADGPLPAWLAFDSATMTLSGMPGDADTGNLQLRLSATDGDGKTVSAGFTLSVADINQAPLLAQPVADQSATEASPFSITIPVGTFADADVSDVLSYALALADGPLPAWLTFDSAGMTLSGTPGDADTGTLQLRLTATDSGGKAVSAGFALHVANINQAPVLVQTIASQSATEASPFSITIPAGAFADADGDALSYALALADGPLPAWLSFDSASMTLSGTPTDADTGTLQLRMTATDSGGKSVSTAFSLNVANINQAPVLVQAAASQSVEDNVAFSYVLPENMFSDADAGDSGVLAIDGLPAGFSFDAQTRTISGTASLATVGQHALTISFTDAGALGASAGFTLTVTAAASMSLTGTAGNDVLTGKSNGDVLLGLGGDDVLNGGIGADRMEGGNGNDTFYVDNTGDVVVENSAAGVDTVMSSIDYTLGVNVERLILTGNAALNATGNTMNNLITGNSGANLINGGLGDDSMAGGAGDDTYMVGSTSDIVTEELGAGFDHVISSVGRTLGANQEALTLTGTAAINGTGNLFNNLLQGNSGINTLLGGDGHDILQGGGGDDYLSDASVLGNLFDGGLGIDRLIGGAGNDLFIGGAGNDTITTGTGADIIAFNRGDGLDSVALTNGSDNTLSLGNGILFSDLALLKSGSDLILKTGLGEQISFKGWYSSATANSVGTLQVVTEGGVDYVAGSASAIHDNKVEQFDFSALVAKFDQVRAGQGGNFNWSVGASLEQFSSGGSDTAAIGADLAYQYAVAESLAALSAMPALAIVGSPSFGAGNQDLQSASALNDGIAVLY